jgi:hypothetical protein
MRLFLSPPAEKETLEDFLCALSDALDAEGCDTTLRHTVRLAPKFGLPVEPLVEWLMDWGGHCDCEVFLNVVPEHPEFVLPFLEEDDVPEGEVNG